MTLPAKVTISSFQSNVAPYRGVTIEIIDGLSGCHIISATMTHDEFGMAVTGLGHCSATHDLTAEFMATKAWRIGRKVRAETVNVPFDCHEHPREDRESIEAAMGAQIMRDTGCAEVRTSDLFNSHRRSKGDLKAQNVMIWFYDEVTEEGA